MSKCQLTNYKCPTCLTEQKHYAWDNELKTTKQDCVKGCKKKLTDKNLFVPEKIDLIGIRTPTKNRV